MTQNVVFTVGNGMMGDDAAGVLLAAKLREAPLEHWISLHGGSMPENYLYRVRELAPERVIVVDAADMDLPPGAIRRIHPDKIDDPFILTTHLVVIPIPIKLNQRVSRKGAIPPLVPCVPPRDDRSHVEVLRPHEQLDIAEQSMNVQLPRPPSFFGQIGQPGNAIGEIEGQLPENLDAVS